MCIQNQYEEHYGEHFLLSVFPSTLLKCSICNWAETHANITDTKETQWIALDNPFIALLTVEYTFVNMLLFPRLSYLLFWNKPCDFIRFCFPVDVQWLFDHGKFRDISALALLWIVSCAYGTISDVFKWAWLFERGTRWTDVWWWRSWLNILFLQRTEECKTEWG